MRSSRSADTHVRAHPNPQKSSLLFSLWWGLILPVTHQLIPCPLTTGLFDMHLTFKFIIVGGTSSPWGSRHSWFSSRSRSSKRKAPMPPSGSSLVRERSKSARTRSRLTELKPLLGHSCSTAASRAQLPPYTQNSEPASSQRIDVCVVGSKHEQLVVAAQRRI